MITFKSNLVLFLLFTFSVQSVEATTKALGNISEKEYQKEETVWQISQKLNESIKDYYSRLSKRQVLIPHEGKSGNETVSVKLCDLNKQISEEEIYVGLLKAEIGEMAKIRKHIRKKKPDSKDYAAHLKHILRRTPYLTSKQLRQTHWKTQKMYYISSRKLKRYNRQKQKLLFTISAKLSAQSILNDLGRQDPDFVRRLTRQKTLSYLKEIFPD